MPKLLFAKRNVSRLNNGRLAASNLRRGLSLAISFAISFYGILIIEVPLAHAFTQTWAFQGAWSNWSSTPCSLTTTVPDSLALSKASCASQYTSENPPLLSADGSTLYIINRLLGTVTKFDTATNAIISTTPFGAFQLNTATLSPDGSRLYIRGRNQDGACLVVVDTSTNSVVTSLNVGGFPEDTQTLSADGSKLYLFINTNINGTNATVKVYDTATNAIVSSIPVGNVYSTLRAGSLSPDGSKLYVKTDHQTQGNTTASTVSVISTSTNSVIATITVGLAYQSYPSGPGSAQEVLSSNGNTLYVLNSQDGTISIINTSTNSIASTVSFPSQMIPTGIYLSPAGTKLYVLRDSYSNTNGAVDTLSTSTNTITNTVSVGVGTYHAVMSADGSKLYVANFSSGTVSAINTSSNSVVTTNSIATGASNFDVVLSASGTKLYALNYANGAISLLNTTGSTFAVISDAVYLPASEADITLGSSGGSIYTWNSATALTTLPAHTSVVLSYSSDNLTFVQNIASVPPSQILYIKARLLTSDLTVTPQLNSLSIDYGNSPPNAPTAPTATTLSDSAVDLSWTASTGATSYKVFQGASGSETLVGTSTGTFYHATGLVANTNYFYDVSASNSNGDSPVSTEVSATTAPAVPANPSATAVSSSGIDVSWTASAAATGYVVFSSPDGAAYTQLATPTSSPYHATGLSSGTTRYYEVEATDANGTSVASPAVHATTPISPSVPIGLSASAVSSTAIDVSWTASPGATGYVVLQGTSPGGEAQVGTVASSPYHATGLTPGNTYYYMVEASSAGGTSAASSEASASTPVNPPAIPTNPGVSVVSSTVLDVSWTASSGATSYKLLQGTSPGGETQVANPAGSSYHASQLVPNTTYYFQVLASNAAGDSPASSEVSATTPPAVPTGLTATTASSSQVNLTWNASSGATSYAVQQSPNGTDSFVPVGSAVAGTSLNVTGLTAGTTYYFEVRANAASGSSAFSTPATAGSTLVAAPAAATNPAAASVAPGSIDVTWTASAGATSYKLLQGTASGGEVQVGTSGGSPYHATGLADNTRYYFKVVASNAGGDSASSGEVSATSPAAAPTSPASTAVSGTAIDLSWAASAGATGYRILASTDGTAYAPLATSVNSPYHATALSPGTTYYFEVQATNANGTSAASAAVHAMTFALPAVPTSLATSVVSNSALDISWSASSGATAYQLWQGTSSGGETQVATPVSSPYHATGLAAATSYYFYLKATGPGGTSGASVEVTTATPVLPPAAPTALSAATSSSSAVTLGWTAPGGTVSGYKILESMDNATFVQVGTSSSTSYAATGLNASTQYFFEVKASNAGGDSPASSVAQATTQAPPPPAAPTGIQATVLSVSAIDIAWTAPVGPVTGYKLYLGTSSGGETLAASPNVSPYHATGLAPATAYYVKVVASNTGGDSVTSTEASATTQTPSASSITNVAATTTSSTATVSWTTDWPASTRLAYGIDASYGTMTAVSNSVGVTSHTVSISGLAACATIHYQALSGALAAPDRTLQTSGCPGNASVTVAVDAGVSPTLGGNVALTNNATGLDLTVPAGATGGTRQFSIKQLTTATAMGTTGVPENGLSLVGTYLYDLQALADPATFTSSFSTPLTVRIAFSPSDLARFDSNTLTLRQWDMGTGWSKPTGCIATAQSIACQVTHFSVFALFADAAAPTATTTATGGTGVSQLPVTGSSAWLLGVVPGLALGGAVLAGFVRLATMAQPFSKAVADTAPPIAPADPSLPGLKRKRGLKGDVFFALKLA